MKSFLAFDRIAALNSLKFEPGIAGVFAGNENCRYREMSNWEEQSEFEPIHNQNRHRKLLAMKGSRKELTAKSCFWEKIKWADSQKAVTFLGCRPTRS